ncbi:hypothetical protein Dimus_017596, partial [Dionaea muscipula]
TSTSLEIAYGKPGLEKVSGLRRVCREESNFEVRNDILESIGLESAELESEERICLHSLIRSPLDSFELHMLYIDPSSYRNPAIPERFRCQYRLIHTALMVHSGIAISHLTTFIVLHSHFGSDMDPAFLVLVAEHILGNSPSRTPYDVEVTAASWDFSSRYGDLRPESSMPFLGQESRPLTAKGLSSRAESMQSYTMWSWLGR